jgi:uncharacterized protein YneF (UPF0154 family)
MIKIIVGFLIGFIAGFIVGRYSYKLKVDEITDNKPVTDTNVANAMQLSNELKDYIYKKDDKLYIKVVKCKK